MQMLFGQLYIILCYRNQIPIIEHLRSKLKQGIHFKESNTSLRIRFKKLRFRRKKTSIRRET